MHKILKPCTIEGWSLPVRPPSKVAIRNYGIIRTNYPRHKPHTKSKRRATLRLLLLLLPGSSKIGPNCGIIKNLLRFTTLPTYSLLSTQGTRYWIALGCSYQETDKLQHSQLVDWVIKLWLWRGLWLRDRLQMGAIIVSSAFPYPRFFFVFFFFAIWPSRSC